MTMTWQKAERIAQAIVEFDSPKPKSDLALTLHQQYLDGKITWSEAITSLADSKQKVSFRSKSSS